MTTLKEPLQEYPSGANRSLSAGKGRFDLISPYGLKRLAVKYEEGSVLHGERNWEKGFPIARCIESAMRHLSQIMMGDTTEDHWAAVAWQAFAAMHFEEKAKEGK